MIFSKTFGYALRAILFIALKTSEKPKIQLDEIAEQLTIPRHFLGNVMKKLVKEGVVDSMKGPFGGFFLNKNTTRCTLYKLMEITGEVEDISMCVLRLRKCNSINPCPIHHKIDALRKEWKVLLSTTTINDLLKKDKPDFIKSIAVI